MTTPTIPVLFGTETGNAEYCADLLVEALEEEGFSASLIDMADFNPDETASHPVLFIVTSTYGNGDPPANAERMLDYLQKDSPKLSGLNFAVCGLGDTSFHHFAQCGKDFEKALLACSAKAMFDRVDCDEDYEVSFDAFKESAVSYLRENKDSLFNPETASSNETDPAAAAATTDFTEAKVGGAERVYQAKLLEKVLLSKPGSAKETMHYELELPDSETGYRVGDCFAVDPENSARAIASVLTAAQMTGDEMVSWRGETIPLREALQSACLQQVTLELVRLVAKQPGAEESPAARVLNQENAQITAFLKEHYVVDLLEEHDTSQIEANTLMGALRKLQPRLFSVASSPTKDAQRVGFTIETVRYERKGKALEGVATCWLADRVHVGDSFPVRLVKNDDFQFPQDGTSVIMVGPGTGIAPFRAFLEEVEACQAPNDTWLFFGHQHEAYDFLYETEIKRWLENGTLDRADFAWSRDQEQKVYVQNKIEQSADQLWSWLERGARIYVCGDAEGMAPGVASAFKAVATKQGGIHDADAWLQQLVDSGRYKTDVY